MTVNPTLATYSDWTYATAIVIYVLSMLFYLAEQAFGRFARRSERVEASEVATGAGSAGGGTTVLERPATPRVTPADRPLPERLGRMGVALTVLGVLLHAAAVLTRGLAVHRVPWGNMYEYGSAVCLAAMVTWLVLMRRFPIRRLTGFVLLPIVVLLFLGGTVLYANAAPLQPALQSYWLVIHVSAAAASSGILLLPGVASLLYLVRTAHERNPQRFTRLAARLPEADLLDRLAYRTTIFAFPLFTFGIVCGAIWAESAWGRFWNWDPKETTALVAWVVYAAYLHARATAGWRGNRAAAINVLGFAVMVFNLFFINLVVAGLHSYAGVNG
jgi:cytochrome c-type biogenesis protein CcsB